MLYEDAREQWVQTRIDTAVLPVLKEVEYARKEVGALAKQVESYAQMHAADRREIRGYERMEALRDEIDCLRLRDRHVNDLCLKGVI